MQDTPFNSHRVLFERAKLSECLQGMLDVVEILYLEDQRIRAMYNWTGGYTNWFSNISNLRNSKYQLQDEINSLRKQGL